MIVHNSSLTQELTYYRPQLVYIKNVFHAEKFIEQLKQHARVHSSAIWNYCSLSK